MKDLLMKSPSENKTRLAKKLGISRTMLYYEYKQPIIDNQTRTKILEVLDHHCAYGHKRIAMELKLNRKRILRVMKKFGIKPYKRRVKKPKKIEDQGKLPSIFTNQIENICPVRPNIIWVGDFTYIPFKGKFLFLATVMDLFTREIIGSNISMYHNKELVIGALVDALKNTGYKPRYFHCDQGSEYDSKEFIELLQLHKIMVSMSRKSSPWENAFQESFYSQFKVELGFTSRFETEAELIEAIYQTIYYYNHDRIHTSLKTSPVKFRLIHDAGAREYLYNKWGT